MSDPDFAFHVTEPVAVSAGLRTTTLSSVDQAYVSIVPGSLPDATDVRISNAAVGYDRVHPVAEGGLDPVPVPATVGDTIEVAALDAAGVVLGVAASVVADREPPVVVRTRPPRKKRDVPINSVLMIVFSEPVDPTSLDGGILLLQGSGPVPIDVSVVAGSPFAVEIAPRAALEALTSYRLVASGVRDLAGDTLTPALDTDFQTGPAPEPIPLNSSSVSAGAAHTCAVAPDRTTVCWGELPGSIEPGRIDDRTFTGMTAGGNSICGFSQTFIDCIAAVRFDDEEFNNGVLRYDVSGIRRLFAGGYHVCADTQDDEIMCWGDYYHQGGQTPQNAGSLMRILGLGATGGLDERLFSLTSGFDHDCGLTAAGEALCWGRGAEGQRGHHIPGIMVAEAVVTDLRFSAIGAGGNTTCGVSLESTLYCWGAYITPAADSTTKDPVSVPLPETIAPVSLAVGAGQACVLSADGAAYCWSDGSRSQPPFVHVGNGPSEPVPGLTFRSLSAGPRHTCGTTLDEEVYCWGANDSGQLGDGTTEVRDAPVRVFWIP